jgi:hypothetical protein
MQTGKEGVSSTANNSASEAVILMLKEGFRIAREQDTNTPDAETHGGALIQTALERFILHPEIAAEVKAIFASYVNEDDPIRRYTLWSILRGYLDDSLNHCSNVAVFHTAWKVRREIVEEQQRAIIEAVGGLLPALVSFLDQVRGIETSGTQFLNDFKSIEPDGDIRDTLDILLYEIDTEAHDMSAAAPEVDKLRDKVTEIANSLNKKILSDILQLRRLLEAEASRDKDTNLETPSPRMRDEGTGVWEPGAYQQIVEAVIQADVMHDDDSVVYWLSFLPTNTETNIDFSTQLVEIHNEAKRLQHIRYNLYALQHFEKNLAYSPDFARIDQNWLLPPVATIYGLRISECLTPDGIRTGEFRRISLEIIGTPKIGLKAF